LAPRPARPRRRRAVTPGSEGRGRRGGELGRVRVPDRHPGEEGEETVELARHPRETDLLDEALGRAEREGMAHRVELARVEVDECRTAAAETRALRQALGPQREHAEVEAAPVRHAQRPERDGRRGNLEQHGARGRRDPGRPERRLAQPVEVGAHRKEARVVAEAGGGDRIERPERLALDRPRGRAEAEHRGAELVLEEPPRVAELALDAGGVPRGEERVLEPVAGDLGAGGARAGGLRFWALGLGLPHPLARPDEEVVLAQTEAPARGEVLLDWSIYPGAYVDLTWAWGAAGLRAGRLLGCFPPGGYLSVLREHPERLILVDRVLSAAAGTATVALLVAGARAALGPGAALAAGVL